ncbi:endonuclease/exonuclease/phosphatase family protein [Sediminitomix flava]|uniref:Endonuclease/exonuclease/phosphatase family metal-dependent hydrolase n=1 Tax=Sediminitomix flava TaxID=379075 RepID=A0A315ZDM4_SEDFL|nr:endonuclease/exonuclease/phosphatase family protein [Sediminitomix flava]PWJ43233.1 endonuclease/exonuclease/phosphatase family metal-dependent hydrolase [Sediminitomix flava]
MKVATYNIENLDFKGTELNPVFQERKPVLQAMLRRLDSELIFFQEIHGQEYTDEGGTEQRDLLALKDLLEDGPYENYFLASTKTSENKVYDKRNLVILSKYPITEVNQYRNDKIEKLGYRKVTAEPAEEVKDVSWERPILHVKIDHPELGELHLINLHLKSRLASNVSGQKDGYKWNSAAGWAEGYFLSSIKRVGQAIETRILLDEIFEQEADAKIIVCGDFNAEPDQVPVEAIIGSVENTSNPSLRSKVMIPCSNGIPSSIQYSHLHHGHKNLLDHMLISQSLVPYFQSASIFNENLHDESLPFASDQKFPESDHAAFVSTFKI